MTAAAATKTFTIKNPLDPASFAQINYLSSLIKSKDHEIVAKVQFALASNAVKKGQASEWIDTLVKAPKKTAVVEPVKPVAYAALPAPVIKPVPVAELPVPAYGYYLVPGQVEDALFAFDEFKAQYGTKVKLMKLKTIKKPVWNSETSEYDYVPKGKWIYAGGTFNAKKALVGQTPITAAKAGEIGKLYGICIRCGRTLTDPVSVAQGIGPVCITYGNWGV